MSNIFKELFEMLITSVSSDVTPEDRKAARRVFVKVGWRIAIFMSLFWAYGLLEPIGLGDGFAHAAGLQKRIEDATKPINDLLAEQQTSLRKLSDQVMRSLAEAKAAEIRALVYKRCKSISYEEKDGINKEIDRKQDEYKNIRGKNDPYEVRCAEVT